MSKVFTPAQRQQFLEHLAQLKTSRESIEEAAMAPFRPAMLAIDEIEEDMFEQFSEQVVGPCEICSEIVFTGDKGHRDEDTHQCEKCAPTWGRMLADLQREQLNGDIALEELENFRESYARHIEGGGSADDRILEVM